jgi:hypothetical protein
MSKNRNMQPAMTADLDQAWAEARQWLAESDPTEVYSLLQILDDDSPGRLLEAMQTNQAVAEAVQNLANLGLCEAHERLFAAMAAESQGKR